VGTGAQKLLEDKFPLTGGFQALNEQEVLEFVFSFDVTHRDTSVENGFQFKRDSALCQVQNYAWVVFERQDNCVGP
jgi:hypothetical protein